MIAKYRKKPVEVEAIWLSTDIEVDDEDSLDANTRAQAEIAGWMLGSGFTDFSVHGNKAPYGIAIKTLEGTMIAEPGDWIIRGVQGEFYPCKPDIFEQTYDAPPVEPAATDFVQRCGLCQRERTLDDAYDYNPIQAVTGRPLGWYSGDDGELCPECMTKMHRGQL